MAASQFEARDTAASNSEGEDITVRGVYAINEDTPEGRLIGWVDEGNCWFPWQYAPTEDRPNASFGHKFLRNLANWLEEEFPDKEEN